MSRSTKPCPGCQQIRPSRGADEVCYECREKLEFYSKLLVEQKGELKRKEVKCVRVPGEPHWLPYIPYARRKDAGTDFGGGTDLGSRFSTTFRELALGLSEPSVDPIHCDTIASYSIEESPGGGGDARLMQPGVIRCLRFLYDTAREIADNAYAEGHAAGLMLLKKVQSGEVSVNESEVTAARVAQTKLKRARRR